ncbi:MAG: hypothetical protein JXA46_04060 [Dehalococcoidales bacterium]|nr:hypothetical protein [Dehalococcoidales bacterium]
MSDAELGEFLLTVKAEYSQTFKTTPGRLLHASLLRRLELVNPGLSAELHDTPSAVGSVEKPWTVSSLLGNIHYEKGLMVLEKGRSCRIRITALSSRLISALQAAFDPDHALGREPLILG